jgi:hypothetical protein
MIEIRTEVKLTGVSGKKISDFLLRCNDQEYQNWWPGTHIAWHTKRQHPDDLGNVVHFDEYVGKRRLKFDAVVVKYVPGKEVIWQMKKFIKLPAWLIIGFEDNQTGTLLLHTIKAGLPGLGRLLDPLLKLFFTEQFRKDMDEHANIEFNKLSLILS